MKQFISKKLILPLLSLLIFSSYLINFFAFSEYSQIDYTDHDEGFLLEQLILKLKYFNINQSISSIAEYGVEFYYFKYLFIILSYIFDLDILTIYKIKILINGVLAFFALFYLLKIFDLLNINKIFYFFFLISLLSVPDFFFLTISLKPDLNTLFFTLVISYYYFIKSSIYEDNKNAYLFLFFLALSLSIKAWSLPFIILLLFNNFNYLKKITFYHKVSYIILIIFSFYLINLYFYEFKNFIISDLDFIKFYNNIDIKFVTFIYEIFKSYFVISLVIINLVLITILILLLRNKKFINFTLQLSIFFSLWLIIWFPYISDFNVFLKTIIGHSYATVLNTNSPSYENYENIFLYTIYDIKNSYISVLILIVFLISPFIYYFERNNIFKSSNSLIPLMILCILMYLFVNLISDYSNQYPAKNLYFIFINFYVFYFLNFYYERNKKYHSFFLILLIPFVFNFYSNFDKYLDYINYLKIDKKTQKLVKSHDKKINFDNKTLILCSSSYPINFDKNSFHKVTFKLSIDCFDKNFINELEVEDIIFFDSIVINNNNTKYFLNNLKLFYNDEFEYLGRFGSKQTKKHYFYIKS